MEKLFQRRKEDFECLVCGTVNIGDGYTNHCHNCLWSRHVDINPGDRGAECQGLMEPIDIEKKGSDWIITHKCQECKFERRQRASRNDSIEAIARITTL